MKKIFVLIPAVALALVSCVKTQDVYTGAPESREIAISALSLPATKTAADTYAGPIASTTFPADLNMYVAAYQVSPTPANYFGATQFTNNGSYWGGGKYWPLSEAYLNFLAIANAPSATFDATTPASGAEISFDASGQNDLMYAIGHAAVSQSGNGLTFPNVEMSFRHALAWISFRVKGAAAITISSITLNGANYSGTYAVDHTNYDQSSDQSASGVWSSVGSSDNVAVPNWTSAALTNEFVGVGNGLMIVPNPDSTSDFTGFTIAYTLNGRSYSYTYVPDARNVDQGKHYVYDLTFTLHEILVDASVSDWVTDLNGNSTDDDNVAVTL